MRRTVITLSVVLSVVVIAAWGFLTPARPAEAETPRIQFALEFINSRATVLWVAQEKGFFARERLQVDIVPIRGGTAGAQAITAGQVQFSLSATAASLPAIAAGSDVVELMNFEPVIGYLLVAGKGIHSPAELKGKPFAVSGLGLSNSSLGARLALRHFGLDPIRDQIALMATGTETDRVLAIVSGRVAATVLAPEFRPKVEAAGVSVLADLRTLNTPWAGSNLVTTRRYLQSNRESVDAVLKALLRAIAFIREPRNKPVVLDVLREKLGLEQTAVAQVYQDLLTYYLVPKPYPRLESIQFMIREAAAFLPQLGTLKAEEVAALEPLRALDQSGWIDSLSAGTPSGSAR